MHSFDILETLRQMSDHGKLLICMAASTIILIAIGLTISPEE